MDRLADTSAVVVGGGFGGLSTACHLADRGADVTLVEKNEQLGGRASTLERDGFRFDMGPSWYLMPDVYERFFAGFDREPGEFYDLERLDPQYRVFFEDGDRFDATGDPAGTAARFEAYESGAGEAFERYLARSRETYEVGMERFVYEDRSRLREFLSLDVLRSARGLPLLRTMADHVGRYFEHPKLRQLVQYPLVFLGGSPYNTPALYSLMTHVDVNLGVHYPAGGMAGVVDAVADLARDLGVETRVDSEVTGIGPAGGPGGVDGRGRLRVETGDSTRSADCVVSDADYAHTERELLDPAHRQYDDDYWASRTLAPSAFLCYLGVEGDLAPLAHHNLVLPSDWDPHFERIFDDPAWPEDPAYYVCAPSRTDDAVAPAGHGNLFVLVPIAPGLPDGPEIRERFADRVLADLAEKTGVDVRDRIVVSETFCVSEFAERYNSLRGTALGLAHTRRQTAPFRPPHRSAALDDLYFVGADTTPGIGVPMCLISGELTADYVAEDVGS